MNLHISGRHFLCRMLTAYLLIFSIGILPVNAAYQSALMLDADSADNSLSPRAARLADLLQIRQDVRTLQKLKQKTTTSLLAGTEQEARRRVTEKILVTFLQTQAVWSRIEGEIARSNDQLWRMQHITDRGVRVTNTSNFLGRGTLGIIGSANRIADFSLVGNLLQLCGSSISVSFSLISLHKMKGPKCFCGNEPNMLAKVLGASPVSPEVDYPETLWSFLNTAPPGEQITRRQELLELWREQDTLKEKATGKEYVKALCGMNPQYKITTSLLNRRINMLKDLMATIIDVNVNLLELLSAIPEPVLPVVSSHTNTGLNLAGKRKIMTSLLEVQATWSHINKEITSTADQLRYLEEKRNKGVELTNVTNFSSKGTLGGTGSALNMASMSLSGNTLQLIGSSVSVLLAMVSFHKLKGSRLTDTSGPNMLIKVLGFAPPLPAVDYPSTVWAYLNNVPKGQKESPRARLIKLWYSRNFISNERNGDETLSTLAGLLSKQPMSIGFLRTRLEMLRDLNAQVIGENIDLLNLYKALAIPARQKVQAGSG